MTVLAVRLVAPDARDHEHAVTVGQGPEPDAPAEWTTVRMRAATINASDFATMRGHGADRARLPTILGSDGAGIDAAGNEVIIYPIIGDPTCHFDDPMLDPTLRMLSQGIDGTFAQTVHVPAANLIPKPPELSWEAAACLGTAWLTAYRALFTRAAIRPGETVLVHGAGGGIATAAIILASAGGARVWVISRTPARAERAVTELGADAAFGVGDPLPDLVDVVIDCVGTSVDHALTRLRPGGRLVLIGVAGGAPVAPIDLPKVFIGSLSILGTAMGSPTELTRLAALCARADIAIPIDSVWPLDAAHAAFTRARSGEAFGKIVLHCD
ncbi:zinc-binding dehydrogenase [Nocardia sp. NPDC056000]|uniref:zinc-binding dehydrogenase n=1 Tax=Nocardia sp. NPDC056000 TaxID=3345674 RepID=UPI0035DF2920